MRLVTKGATFLLGRPRRDGYRRILAVRLADWSPVIPLFPKPGVRTRVARDKPDILEPAKVRSKRVRMKIESRCELPHRNRAAGQSKVAIQPEPCVIGERLVNVEGLGFGQ